MGQTPAPAPPGLPDPILAEELVDQCIGMLDGPDGGAPSCIGEVAQLCSQDQGQAGVSWTLPCMQSEIAIWDDRLDRAIGRLTTLGAGQPAKVAALTASQADWIAFRDSECALQQVAGPDPQTEVGAAYCRLQMTGERVIDLGWLNHSFATP